MAPNSRQPFTCFFAYGKAFKLLVHFLQRYGDTGVQLLLLLNLFSTLELIAQDLMKR